MDDITIGALLNIACQFLFVVLLLLFSLSMWSGYFAEDEIVKRVVEWEKAAEKKERV